MPITKTPGEIFLEKAIRNDSGAWFANHAKIWPKDRAAGLIRPKSNYLQKKIQQVVRKMKDDEVPVRIIGLKPRQKGSTTYFACIDYTEIRRAPTAACVIGGQYSQTKELWEMLQTYQTNDGFNWGNEGQINAKEGKWTNGSKLKPETAGDVLAGISGTYQVLHATEVARWAKYGIANAAEVLANILKCVPNIAGTTVILESTAEGATGDFYTRYVDAVDAEDYLAGTVTLMPGQYVRVFAPWFEFEDSATRLTAEQKRHIERTLDSEEEYFGEKQLVTLYGNGEQGERRLGGTVKNFDIWEQLAWRRWAIRNECKRDRLIFDRDYPHSWKDAFQKSGNVRFNSTGLAIMQKRVFDRVPKYGVLEMTKDGIVSFRPTEIGEAKVIIFEMPISGKRYLETCDPMTGATQVGGKDPDYHGVFVMRPGNLDNYGNWERPATVARIIRCRWDIDVLELEMWKLAKFYGNANGCKIAIEMEMDRGLTELLKIRGADLYQRELFNQREMKTTKAYGWMTTAQTREVIVEKLATAIREWDTTGSGIDVFCAQAIEQMENFVTKESGKSEAAEGHHDDDVMSIAIGHQLLSHATLYTPAHIYGRLPPDLRNEGGFGAGTNNQYG